MVFDLCYESSSLLAANGFSFTKLTYKILSGFFNETKNRPIALFTTIFCIMSLAASLLIAKKGFDSRIDIDNEFAVEALIFLAFALFAVKPLISCFIGFILLNHIITGFPDGFSTFCSITCKTQVPNLPACAPARLALPIHWGLAMTWRLGRRAGSQWQAGRIEDPPTHPGGRE
jgi:hypothetical protein